MIAIRITQDIKDKNKQNFIQKAEKGTILKKNEYPNRFYVTENVIGGYSNRTDLHKSDGWKPFINPSYDNKTQKLGEKIETETSFTIEVIDLSQEEIDDLANSKEDNLERETISTYIDDGRNTIEKVKAKMFRKATKFKDATLGLTRPQVGKLDRWFSPVYLALFSGDFRNAQKEIIDLIEERGSLGDSSLLEAEGMLETAEFFRDLIVDYFTNKYDL